MPGIFFSTIVATSAITAIAFFSASARAEAWITYTTDEFRCDLSSSSRCREARLEVQIDIDNIRKVGDIVVLKEREKGTYLDSPGLPSYSSRTVLINCSTGEVKEQDNFSLSYRRLGRNKWISAWSDIVFNDKGRITPVKRSPGVTPEFHATLYKNTGVWSGRARRLNGRWPIACPQPKPANLI